MEGGGHMADVFFFLKVDGGAMQSNGQNND